MTEFETILITETMDNKDLYHFFIKRTRLNLKFIRYNGIRYKVIIGDDIKKIIEDRKIKNRLDYKPTYLKNYNDRLIREIQRL